MPVTVASPSDSNPAAQIRWALEYMRDRYGLPKLDALVLYTLDEADAEKITAWRENFAAFNAGMSGHKHPHRPGTPGSTGHVAHVGSPVRAGDVRPARVTAVPDPESGRLNLKVSLDGSDFYWAAGVPPGDGPGQWTDLP